MNSNVARFDRQAGLWDENPVRAALSRAIVGLAEREIAGLPQPPRLMDYGCGTGMCSLPLARLCESVTAVDVSPGMLEKLREKAAAHSLGNVCTLCHDLSQSPLPGACGFDVILSAMALHHVREVPRLITALSGLLAPGGVLLLADLDHEDGSFHDDATGVEHQGFRREWLLNLLWEAGCRDVRIQTAHVIEKPVASGATGRFPVFFMTARTRA
ncbi:MAG: class I SAM-dependent DNA methyltransferase [Chthoniobacteraceae bacterium]